MLKLFLKSIETHFSIFIIVKNHQQMILKYKTDKLPLNFIYLGLLLFGLGIWRMIEMDWRGILFFIISLIFLFLRSGIIINTENKSLKQYTGIFVIKIGKWESIKSIINLQITKTRETQGMHVLSISRSETVDVYKLLLTLPDRKIELMAGEKEQILNRADTIASALNVSIINKTI